VVFQWRKRERKSVSERDYHYCARMKWLRLPKIGHDRTVEHYISCPLRADAERVKSIAEADGYAVRLEKPTQFRWVVTVSHTANPTPLYQRRMERKWDAVAATVKDGSYDGWGTEWGHESPPGWRDPES
jgi:hypothetical protein